MADAGAVPLAALPMATVAAEAVAAPSLLSLPPPSAPRHAAFPHPSPANPLIPPDPWFRVQPTPIWFLQHYLLFVRLGYRLLPLRKSLLLFSRARGITTSSTCYSVTPLGLRFQVLFSAALQQILSLLLNFLPLLLV